MRLLLPLLMVVVVVVVLVLVVVVVLLLLSWSDAPTTHPTVDVVGFAHLPFSRRRPWVACTTYVCVRPSVPRVPRI